MLLINDTGAGVVSVAGVCWAIELWNHDQHQPAWR